MDLSLFQSLYIFLATFVGEVFGTMFGGGSFFIQPALLMAKIPANLAVANDIASATFSSLAYVFFYRKQEKQLDYQQYKKIIIFIAPFLVLGAIIGSSLLAQMPEFLIKWFILGICSVGLCYMVFKTYRHTPASYDVKKVYIKYWRVAAVFAMLFIGFYDGISGAGSGIMVILLLTLIFRQDMKTTLVLANILSIITLSSASIMFLYHGLLDFNLLSIMIPACLAAGFTGAKIVTVIPEKILRLVYITLVFILLIYLFTDMVRV